MIEDQPERLVGSNPLSIFRDRNPRQLATAQNSVLRGFQRPTLHPGQDRRRDRGGRDERSEAKRQPRVERRKEGNDAARRLLPLRCGQFFRALAHPTALHALLLLDLSQDGGRQRCCDQPHGRRQYARRSRVRTIWPSTVRVIRPLRMVARRRNATFCRTCGSALFLSDARWPELVHPHASAIDTPLAEPAERTHIMLDSKASWVRVPEGPGEKHFSDYPGSVDRGLAQDAGALSLALDWALSAQRRPEPQIEADAAFPSPSATRSCRQAAGAAGRFWFRDVPPGSGTRGGRAARGAKLCSR